MRQVSVCAASVQKTQMQKDQKGREAIKGGEKKSPELAALATKSLFICVTRSELWVMQIKSSAEPASEHKGLLVTHQHTQPAIRGGCDGNQRDLSVLQLRGGTSLTLSEETPGWLIVVVELRALCARERQKNKLWGMTAWFAVCKRRTLRKSVHRQLVAALSKEVTAPTSQ